MPGFVLCCGFDVSMEQAGYGATGQKAHAGGVSHPPRVVLPLLLPRRYGTLTEVLSPELLMVKVPADATGV